MPGTPVQTPDFYKVTSHTHTHTQHGLLSLYRYLFFVLFIEYLFFPKRPILRPAALRRCPWVPRWTPHPTCSIHLAVLVCLRNDCLNVLIFVQLPFLGPFYLDTFVSKQRWPRPMWPQRLCFLNNHFHCHRLISRTNYGLEPFV